MKNECAKCKTPLTPNAQYPMIAAGAYREIKQICWDCYDALKMAELDSGIVSRYGTILDQPGENA